MESSILPFKTLAKVYHVHPQNDSALHQFTLDMVLEGSLFHCKLSTPARSIDAANEIRKTAVYLFLDASHVQSLEICDNEEEVIPSCVRSAFIKQGSSTTADELVSIRFVLKDHATFVAPDSLLQKRPSMIEDIEALWRICRLDTFKVYVSSKAVSTRHILALSNSLARGMKPTPEDVINSIYLKPVNSKIVTSLNDLWTLNRPENPPPYDLSTSLGAIDSDPTSQSDSRVISSSRKHGKRRIASPVSRQTPSKRQLLTEKAVPEPWELAFAALSAEFAILREQVQQLQRAPVVDAGTQTDSFVDHAPESCSVPDPHYSSPSQASTVENSIEDRLLMVEDSILEEQLRRALSDEKLENTEKQLALLDEKLENTDKQIRQELDLECSGLKTAVELLNSRHDELQQEFKEDIDTQKLDLQVKLEEFIDDRLENVEEAVKHDVRVAFENASYKVDVDLGWLE